MASLGLFSGAFAACGLECHGGNLLGRLGRIFPDGSIWFLLGIPGVVLLGHRKWWRRLLWLAMIAFYGLAHTFAEQESHWFPARELLDLGTDIAGESLGNRSDISLSRRGRRRGVRVLLRLESLGCQRSGLTGAVIVFRMVIFRAPTGLEAGDSGDHRQCSSLEPFGQGAESRRVFSATYHAQSHGSVGRLVAGEGSQVLLVEKSAEFSWIALAHHYRESFAGMITRDLEDTPAVGSVIKAMALGYREETPDAIAEGFRLSGTMHVFAVSGLHVMIFAAVFRHLLRLLGAPGRLADGVVIPMLFFYVLITGLAPSAIRAAVMASVVLAGPLGERSPRLLNSLGLAALVLLAWDTRQLFSPGFQLSFAVVLAIALWAKPITQFWSTLVRHDPFVPESLLPRWRRWTESCGLWMASMIGVSWAAWLGSLPLMVWHFQSVTPVGLVANWALVPLASAILTLAALSLASQLAGIAFVGLSCNNLNWLLAKIAIASTGTFSSLPGANFTVSFETERASLATCRMVVIDTNDGGASILMRVNHDAGAESFWLIDTGSSEAFASHVAPVLRVEGVNRLEGLILTHRDQLHDGAAPTVCQMFHPKVILTEPEEGRGGEVRDRLQKVAQTEQSRISTLVAGDCVKLSHGCVIQCLSPATHMEKTVRSGDDNGLVLRICSESSRVLLTADAGFITEKTLLAANRFEDLRSDVLIKGWNRDDYSGLPEFLAAVSPTLIVATNHDFPPRERISENWRKQVNLARLRLFDQQETGAVILEFGSFGVHARPFLTDKADPLEFKPTTQE
ncbi:MAG: ComEC/Rec2 family competence protein [Verrucomicrobiales bacterium]